MEELHGGRLPSTYPCNLICPRHFCELAKQLKYTKATHPVCCSTAIGLEAHLWNSSWHGQTICQAVDDSLLGCVALKKVVDVQ